MRLRLVSCRRESKRRSPVGSLRVNLRPALPAQPFWSARGRPCGHSGSLCVTALLKRRPAAALRKISGRARLVSRASRLPWQPRRMPYFPVLAAKSRFSCIGQALPFWFWNGVAEFASGIHPKTHRLANIFQGFSLCISMGGTAGKFWNFRDKSVVCVAPKNNDFIFIHRIHLPVHILQSHHAPAELDKASLCSPQKIKNQFFPFAHD